MAGTIFFSKRNWSASSWATFHVLEYLSQQAGDPATKDMLDELVANNIPMLDLRDPQHANLVNILADDLPQEMPVLDDKDLQHKLQALLSELVDRAREQQQINCASDR
ncbi:hypothetical protein [Mycobacterium sp. Marseille-P9652]|uniref:hypothetical protein n=1 Tax=Mycobacterium sp. Marseille-P9652 TaxID=2654950 RepID=UPI0012E7084C|nr:hypothetical protein [Mycobacterium sp. Marseille-P9652]